MFSRFSSPILSHVTVSATPHSSAFCSVRVNCHNFQLSKTQHTTNFLPLFICVGSLCVRNSGHRRAARGHGMSSSMAVCLVTPRHSLSLNPKITVLVIDHLSKELPGSACSRPSTPGSQAHVACPACMLVWGIQTQVLRLHRSTLTTEPSLPRPEA